jgi:3-polyprenyl-4-hydroxybenzoate decarboxylase
MAPMWPGAQQFGLRFDAGLLWDQLDSAGIQDVTGVWTYPYLVAVSIRQRFAGHPQQAGLAVITCSATARNGRYVVVVDDDIDVTNFKDVLWAMQTRVDPIRDIQLVDRCWSTPLDPRMPPDKRASGDHTNSRAIFYAVRPWEWRDKYPQPSRVERDRRNAMVEKYRDLFPFPAHL